MRRSEATAVLSPPPGAVSDARLAVLFAVMAEHREHGRVTVRAVQARCSPLAARCRGLRGLASIKAHLDSLRRDGLVGWDDHTRGTLRPLVRAVPFTAAATVPAAESIKEEAR